MKALILTNPSYRDFVFGVAGYNQLVWFQDYKFEFSAIGDYDVGISFMYQHKVPAKEVNSRPWFNFHPAPLPEYKGRNLCYHAIMKGEKEFGATIHYMSEEFDAGDIIDVLHFEIQSWMTAEDVSRHAINQSKNLFKIFFPRILAGEEFERIPNVGGRYYPKEIIRNDLDPITGSHIKRSIRAIYYPPYYPTLEIGGVKYKIVKE